MEIRQEEKTPNITSLETEDAKLVCISLWMLTTKRVFTRT